MGFSHLPSRPAFTGGMVPQESYSKVRERAKHRWKQPRRHRERMFGMPEMGSSITGEALFSGFKVSQERPKG